MAASEPVSSAGVRRVVLLPGHGADRWGDPSFGADMLAAGDAVRGSAPEWTVPRPSNVAQNVDEELWHAPPVAGEPGLPAGSTSSPDRGRSPSPRPSTSSPARPGGPAWDR